MAQERERREQERRRDYRLQVQQRNLGERDAVTIRLDEPSAWRVYWICLCVCVR